MTTTAYRSAIVAISVAALIATFGFGVASAKDPLIGKTYADASETISKWGSKSVISTVFGTQLTTDECIVISWRKASYVEDDNFDHQRAAVLVSLNCNAKLAHPGSPGNSLATAEGRAEKAIEARAELFNSKPQRCADALDRCRQFCDKNAGMCSKEVMLLLG